MPVLVVDESPANRKHLERLLSSWQMKTASAENGRDALRSLRTAAEKGQPFRFVVADTALPELDGYALAEQVGADPRLSGAKVVMTTAANRPCDGERLGRLGQPGCLLKPVVASELLNAMRRAARMDRDAAGTPRANGAEAAGPMARRLVFCLPRITRSTNFSLRRCSPSLGTPCRWRVPAGRRWNACASRNSTWSSWMCKCRRWMVSKPRPRFADPATACRLSP